jgi:hypothetical protein
VATLCQLLDALAHWRSPAAGEALMPALEAELRARLLVQERRAGQGQAWEQQDQPLLVRLPPVFGGVQERQGGPSADEEALAELRQLEACQQQRPERPEQPQQPQHLRPGRRGDPLPTGLTGDVLVLALYAMAQSRHSPSPATARLLLQALLPQLHLLRKAELLQAE